MVCGSDGQDGVSAYVITVEAHDVVGPDFFRCGLCERDDSAGSFRVCSKKAEKEDPPRLSASFEPQLIKAKEAISDVCTSSLYLSTRLCCVQTT